MKFEDVENLYKSWLVFQQKQEEYRILFGIPNELIEHEDDYLFEVYQMDESVAKFNCGLLDWHTVYIPR